MAATNIIALSRMSICTAQPTLLTLPSAGGGGLQSGPSALPEWPATVLARCCRHRWRRNLAACSRQPSFQQLRVLHGAMQLHKACTAMFIHGAARLHASPAFSRSMTRSLCCTIAAVHEACAAALGSAPHPCLADPHIAWVGRQLCSSVQTTPRAHTALGGLIASLAGAVHRRAGR